MVFFFFLFSLESIYNLHMHDAWNFRFCVHKIVQYANVQILLLCRHHVFFIIFLFTSIIRCRHPNKKSTVSIVFFWSKSTVSSRAQNSMMSEQLYRGGTWVGHATKMLQTFFFFLFPNLWLRKRWPILLISNYLAYDCRYSLDCIICHHKTIDFEMRGLLALCRISLSVFCLSELFNKNWKDSSLLLSVMSQRERAYLIISVKMQHKK